MSYDLVSITHSRPDIFNHILRLGQLAEVPRGGGKDIALHGLGGGDGMEAETEDAAGNDAGSTNGRGRGEDFHGWFRIDTRGQ